MKIRLEKSQGICSVKELQPKFQSLKSVKEMFQTLKKKTSPNFKLFFVAPFEFFIGFNKNSISNSSNDNTAFFFCF